VADLGRTPRPYFQRSEMRQRTRATAAAITSVIGGATVKRTTVNRRATAVADTDRRELCRPKAEKRISENR